MAKFENTLKIIKPKHILQKQQDKLKKTNGIRELATIILKKLFLIILTIISLDFFGQSVDKSKAISTLRQIDSLYRQIPNFQEVLLRVHYNSGTRLDLYYPSPDTLIVPKHIGLWLKDSVKLGQYCKNVNIDFNLVFKLFKILISHKYIGLNPDGIKECRTCSNMIFINGSDYYIVKNTKHPCFKNACFNEQTKDRNSSIWTINDLTNDISLVKKRKR